MKNKQILIITTFVGLLLLPLSFSYSQEKTKEELKAEREALKSELKSKATQERKKKLEKLEPPKETGIKSVDELAINATAFLIKTKEFNLIVPEMYKRTIGETIDGVTDVTVKKPTLEELITLSDNILTQINAISNMSSAVTSASNDVKSAPLLQATKASKSLNYSKDVLELCGAELQLNFKVIGNLISTLKSANNY